MEMTSNFIYTDASVVAGTSVVAASVVPAFFVLPVSLMQVSFCSSKEVISPFLKIMFSVLVILQSRRKSGIKCFLSDRVRSREDEENNSQ
uniref:Ovule protein n=1 Tax=Strongyloides venezuelensis TaxID=75913 RepID=A0A0K0F1X3_STRVS